MEIIRHQGEVLHIPLSLFLHGRVYYESSGRTKRKTIEDRSQIQSNTTQLRSCENGEENIKMMLQR